MSGESNNGGWEERGLGNLFASFKPTNTNGCEEVEPTPVSDDELTTESVPQPSSAVIEPTPVPDDGLTTGEQAMEVIDGRLSEAEQYGISQLMDIAELDGGEGEIKIIPDDPTIVTQRIMDDIAAVLAETEAITASTKESGLFSDSLDDILGFTIEDDENDKAVPKDKMKNRPAKQSWLSIKLSGLLRPDKK